MSLKIPEARGLPIVGNLPAMLRDLSACVLQAVRDHGPLVRMRIGGGSMVIVAHPDDLRRVLQDNHRNYIRGATVDLIRPMLGNGLPLSDGEFWLRQRRTMQPAFARPRVAAMVPMFVRIAARYLDALRPGAELETHDLMMRITRDVIVESMFSDSLGPDTGPIDAALAAVERHLARYAFIPVRVPAWLPTPDNLRFRRAVATLHGTVRDLVARRRAEPPEDPPRDLLGGLLAARDPDTGAGMSPTELRDEVMNIFFAGHETTATLLTWTVLMLTRHPEVQARLQAEVDEVLPDHDPTLEDLPRLAYTSAVLRETLRLYPAAWLFAREAVADDELRGHHVPAGTRLTLCPLATHRLAEHWPEPDRFDPDRFQRDPSLGLGGGKHYTYLPFGAGPHVCIGNHLAIHEATVVLAMLTRRGRLRALRPTEARPRPAATLHVADGLPARFEPR